MFCKISRPEAADQLKISMLSHWYDACWEAGRRNAGADIPPVATEQASEQGAEADRYGSCNNRADSRAGVMAVVIALIALIA